VRLSIINFAGTARTLVAVGTVNDASMLCTTRAPTPRMVSSVDAPGVTSAGIGFTTGSAGVGVFWLLWLDMGGVLVPGVVGGVCESEGDGETEGAGEAGAFGETGVAGDTGAPVETEGAGEAGAIGDADVDAVAARFGTGGVPPLGASGIAAAGV